MCKGSAAELQKTHRLFVHSVVRPKCEEETWLRQHNIPLLEDVPRGPVVV